MRCWPSRSVVYRITGVTNLGNGWGSITLDDGGTSAIELPIEVVEHVTPGMTYEIEVRRVPAVKAERRRTKQ